MAQTGNFVHEADNKFFLKLPSSGDIPRVFTVVKYDAYNAGGIIGSEYNGIAILENGSEDDPAMFVVTSGVAKNDSNKAAQVFERLKNATWQELKEACKAAPGYVRVTDMEDDLDIPSPGNIVNLVALGAITLDDEPDLRTPEIIAAHEDPEVPCEFPKVGRVGIITEIMNHAVHRDGHYGDFHLSWNVKMAMNFDETGKSGSEKVDPAFDEQWKEYAEDGENNAFLFDIITHDMASQYLEGLYSTYPGEDQGAYEFGFQGRSGGHMVLKEVDGQEISFSSYSDVAESLKELSDEELIKLWKVTRSLDQDITSEKLKTEFDYQLNFQRSQKEEEWAREMAPSL